MYREMKDSGVKWIGIIPKEWDVIRTKNIYSNTKTIVGDKANNYERLALTLNGVIKRSKEDANGLQPEKFEGYQILKENELVFKLIDLENVATSRVGFSPYTGLVSPAYIVLNNEEHSKFGYYYFISMYYQEIFNKLGGAGVRSNLNAKDLLNIPYLNIEKSERMMICDYLDKKVSQINDIISKQKTLIEKYKVYKQSLITETVTKGLNKNVPMKDSGKEWIGEIPNQWEIKKLKTIAQSPLLYGANESGIEYNENLLRYIRITDITNNNELKEENKLSLDDKLAENFILKNGDLLFARSGATVGKTFLFKDVYGRAAFAGYLIKASFDEFTLSKFVYYFTLSNSYNEWKNRIFIQSTIQNIGADKYSNLSIPIPKSDEQKKIVDFLDEKCTLIDSLISKKEKLIEKLQSYKKSLIYECVTGKREVN